MEGRQGSSGVNLVELGLLHRVDQVLQATEEDRLAETIPLKAVDNPQWIWYYQRRWYRILAIVLPSALSYLFGTLHPTGIIKSLVAGSPLLEALDHVVPGDLAMFIGSVLFGLILLALYQVIVPPVKMTSR